MALVAANHSIPRERVKEGVLTPDWSRRFVIART